MNFDSKRKDPNAEALMAGELRRPHRSTRHAAGFGLDRAVLFEPASVAPAHRPPVLMVSQRFA